MFAVDELALTSSPTLSELDTTLPAIGLTIVACSTACSASARLASAASTAFWSAARSAAVGEDDPLLAADLDPFEVDCPVTPDPVLPVEPVGVVDFEDEPDPV